METSEIFSPLSCRPNLTSKARKMLIKKANVEHKHANVKCMKAHMLKYVVIMLDLNLNLEVTLLFPCCVSKETAVSDRPPTSQNW